jgi:hypothetical protein
MGWMRDWVAAWWCQHRHGSTHRVIRTDVEVFLRCDRCGFRSPGLTPGPLKVHAPLPGIPEHHAMKQFKARVFDIERRRDARRA